MTQINFKQLRQDSKTVVTGELVATIIEAEATVAASSQAPMIKVKFKIVNGPHEGVKIPHNFVISPTSRFALTRFFNSMEALGLDERFIDSCTDTAEIARALVGRTALLTVGERMFQGTAMEDITGIDTPPPGFANRAPVTVAGSASMNMGGMAAGNTAKPTALPTALPATTEATTSNETTDDEPKSTAGEPKLPF
jgi:hypothetical protein